MADGQSRLLLLIEARNQAQGTIGQVRSELTSLSQARPITLTARDQASQVIQRAESSKQRLDQKGAVPVIINATDNASSVIERIESRLDQLQSRAASGGLTAGVIGGGIVAGAQVAIQALGRLRDAFEDTVRGGAQLSRLEDSFDNVASSYGQSSTRILSALQRASQGTISNADLMLTANRAMLLGVADTADEMASLLEVARVRGQALGLSTTQAFNDIVTGIGRMSPLILDNLGIVTGGEVVFERYAAAIGKATDALSDAERKQALVNSVIQGSASLLAGQTGPSNDVATNFERMDAALQNAKDAMGQLFGPAVAAVAELIAAGATKAAEAVTGFREEGFTGPEGQIEGLKRQLTGLQEVRDRLQADMAADSPFFNVSDLAEVQDKIRAIEREIERYGGIVKDRINASNADLTEHSERLDILGLSAQTAAGRAVPAILGISDAVGITAEATRRGAREIRESFTKELDGLRSSIGEDLFSGAGQASAVLGDSAALSQAQTAYKRVTEEIRQLQREVDAGTISADEFSFRLAAIKDAADDEADAITQAARDTEFFNSVMAGESPAAFQIFAAAALAAGTPVAELIGLLQDLKAEIGGIQGARDSAVRSLAGQLAGQVERGLLTQEQASDLFAEGVAKADRAAANLNTQLALTGEATDEFTLAQAQAFQAVNDGAQAIEEADRQAKRYASTLAGDAKRAAAEAAREFENLKGKVAGVLSGALDTGVGVDPDEILAGLGLREDAINENARRLADIAKKGFAGQEWLGDFAQEVPEVFKRLVDAADPKAEAARLLKDFQDGLAPELIDKETAKDRVRRMLLGEARMDELATEIAQELAAELGKPVAEVESRARAALGAGAGAEAPKVKLAPEIDAGALGGAFATGAANAVRDSGVGDRMTTALETQLKSESSLKKMMAAGEAQAQAWGQSFLDTVGENVPARLIEILTNLVTPGVMAQLQVQASLTGAR